MWYLDGIIMIVSTFYNCNCIVLWCKDYCDCINFRPNFVFFLSNFPKLPPLFVVISLTLYMGKVFVKYSKQTVIWMNLSLSGTREDFMSSQAFLCFHQIWSVSLIITFCRRGGDPSYLQVVTKQKGSLW